MSLLSLVSESHVELREVSPFAWQVAVDFRVITEASWEGYIAEMLSRCTELTHPYLTPSVHGRYRTESVTPDWYRPCDPEEAIQLFSGWIRTFPHDPIDPQPVLDQYVRPHLASGELFLLDDPERDDIRSPEVSGRVDRGVHETLAQSAQVLLGWNEVVALDRDARTLKMLVLSGD